MEHHDDERDPLDEKAPEGPKRDSRGRFPKGVSGNPAGRKVQFRRDPNLPAAKRRIISSVADELVEVNVGGKKQVMSLFEANVRALAIDGTKNKGLSSSLRGIQSEISSGVCLRTSCANITIVSKRKTSGWQMKRSRALVFSTYRSMCRLINGLQRA